MTTGGVSAPAFSSMSPRPFRSRPTRRWLKFKHSSILAPMLQRSAVATRPGLCAVPSIYCSAMAEPPDLASLAKRYLDLWQEQLTAMAADPDLAESLARL